MPACRPSTRTLSRLRLGAVFVLLAATVGGVLAAPRQADALALGKGKYSLSASVYGGGDGLVGQSTTSGRILKQLDRLVALPACTESSCPWVPLSAEPGDRWGPQTACAEADGLCWVEIRSDETGECTVAPVLDLGPLFVEDNWWGLKRERTYPYKRGYPAAAAAAEGVDLGYGRGISDVGHNIRRDYSYAAAIDLAAGTWVDLGLDPRIGLSRLRVTLLWQAGRSHYSACGGDYGNASVTDEVNLRAGPGTNNDVLAVVSAGSRVTVTGGVRNGFYLVDVDAMRGWISADYIDPDGGDVGDTQGFLTDAVNLRAGPSTADDVLRVVPEGNMVIITGSRSNGFYPVRFKGTEGWISASYVDAGSTPGGGGGATAVTTDNVNLRTGPSTNRKVLQVIPSGSSVTLTGDTKYGFAAVRYGGENGWVSAAYLSVANLGDERRTTDDVNLRAGPSTADRVAVVVPGGRTVEVLGEQRNGFVKVRYGSRTGWIFAAYLE